MVAIPPVATDLREALMISFTKGIVRNDVRLHPHCQLIVKARALNSRIFSLLYEEMRSEQQSLLFHTSARWVSQGKVLARLFELRHEISQFVSQNNNHLYEHLEDDRWIAKLTK